MSKWFTLHVNICVCEKYIQNVCGRLYACVSTAVVSECCCWGLLHHCPYTVAGCQRKALPPEPFQWDVGEEENIFFPYRCFWIHILILRNSNLTAIQYANVCLHVRLCFLFYIAKGNKCPLSLSKCQTSYQHLSAYCCDICAHTRTRHTPLLRPTKRLVMWQFNELHHLLKNVSLVRVLVLFSSLFTCTVCTDAFSASSLSVQNCPLVKM